MDLQAAQLSTRTEQEVRSTATLSWLDWQLSLFVALCVVGGTILFTILVRVFSNFGSVLVIRVNKLQLILYLGFVMASETNVA